MKKLIKNPFFLQFVLIVVYSLFMIGIGFIISTITVERSSDPKELERATEEYNSVSAAQTNIINKAMGVDDLRVKEINLITEALNQCIEGNVDETNKNILEGNALKARIKQEMGRVDKMLDDFHNSEYEYIKFDREPATGSGN